MRFPSRSANGGKALSRPTREAGLHPDRPPVAADQQVLVLKGEFLPAVGRGNPAVLQARHLREHGVPHRRFREAREVPCRGVHPGGVVPAGVREAGIGKTQFPRPGVHPGHELHFTPGDVVREGVAGVVRGSEERGGEEFEHGHPVTGRKAQSRTGLAARLRGNRDHASKVGPFEDEEGRHHLREAGGRKAGRRVPLPDLPAVHLHEVRGGDVAERIAGSRRLRPRRRCDDPETETEEPSRPHRVPPGIVRSRTDSGFP